MKHTLIAPAVGLISALAFPVSAFGQQQNPRQPEEPTAAVIPLKVASAVEIAKILDQVFNGSGASRTPRIIVFAIPLTNSLFVRATELDLLIVRDLVEPL